MNDTNKSIPAGLRTAVRDQRAVLFLGVGASLESADQNGRPMLKTDDIRDALCDKFLGKRLPGYSLMEAAEIVIGSAGRPVVFEYIRQLLDPFQPAEAHRLLASFRWRALATTNYDLLIERAYAEVAERKQNLVTFVKDSEPIEDRLQQTENPVQFLKLHGSIDHIHDDTAPLILSPEQYDRYLDGRNRLFGRLTDLAYESPIVFCGYRLGDQHIRSLIYRLAPPNVNRPTFYLVLPNVDKEVSDHWAQKQVVVIDMRFGEFMSALNQAIPEHARVLQVDQSVVDRPIRRYYRTHATESPVLDRFLSNDVTLVHADMPYAEQDPKEFYKGNDTGWGGIIQGLDVGRTVVNDVLYDIMEKVEKADPKPWLYVLKGPAGNGKTIALKRAAWELSTTLDQLVLWADQSAALDPSALIELNELTGKPIILFVDRVALHPQRIRTLYETVRKRSVPLIVAGAERDSEWHAYCAALDELSPIEMRVRYMSRRELEVLLVKLSEHKSLGLLEGQPRDKQIKAFEEQAERQLLVALYQATRGKRLEEIVFEEYKGIVPEEARQLYLDICTLNQFSVPVRAGTISRVSGIRFERFEKEFFKPLKNLVLTIEDRYTGDTQYRARHSQVATFVFRRACPTSEDRAEQLIRLVDALDIGYSIDHAALERILKGHVVARMISEVESGRRLFEAATGLAPDQAFLFQHWAIYESTHQNGSLEKAEQYADIARKIDRQSKTIIHTQAEVARKRAYQETAEVLKDQYRRQARERLSEIHKPNDRFVLSTKAKLLIDEIEELSAKEDDDSSTLLVDKIRDAETFLGRAQQLYINDPAIDEIEARFRAILRQKEKFIAALERALKVGTQRESVAIRLAKAYRDRGASDRAYKTLNETLERHPESKAVHLTIAKMMLEDEDPLSQTIEQHLIHSFDAGDRNYEARHLYAQFLFMVGRMSEAADLFADVYNKAPSDIWLQSQKRPSIISSLLPRFTGRVTRKLESFLFIRCPSYPSDIYANENDTKDQDWDELTDGSEVDFEVRFNRRGPIGVDVRLRQ